MNNGRSKFDVLMDLLTVFYDYNECKSSFLIVKANLCNVYQRGLVDDLVTAGIIGVDDKTFYLTNKGEYLVSIIIPSYKKARDLYNKIKVINNG